MPPRHREVAPLRGEVAYRNGEVAYRNGEVPRKSCWPQSFSIVPVGINMWCEYCKEFRDGAHIMKRWWRGVAKA